MKLTDDLKTIDIEMNVWQGTQWGPDISAEFFDDSNIDLEGTGHVKDVDYCISVAMDWYERTGDYTDDDEDEERSVTVDVLKDSYTYVVYADRVVIGIGNRATAVSQYGEATRSKRYQEVAFYRIECSVHSWSKTTIASWTASPKISACPFCGGHHVELSSESLWDDANFALITCRSCGAQIQTCAADLGDITDPFVGKIGPNYQRAKTHLINVWNRRATK